MFGPSKFKKYVEKAQGDFKFSKKISDFLKQFQKSLQTNFWASCTILDAPMSTFGQKHDFWDFLEQFLA